MGLNLGLVTHLWNINYDVDKVIAGVQAYVFDAHPRAERVTVVCPDMKYSTSRHVLCGVQFSEGSTIQREEFTSICDLFRKLSCTKLDNPDDIDSESGE